MGRHDLSAESMIEIALREMTRMGKEYCSEWTFEYYAPWNMPAESVYSVAIGKALKTAAPGSVFMEYTMGEIAKWSRHNEGQIKNPTRRVDVTVMDCREDCPIFCIEVKKWNVDWAGIEEDIGKCEEATKPPKDGILNHAAVVFFVHEERGNNRIREMFEKSIAWPVKGLSKNGGLTSTANNLKRETWQLEGTEYEWVAVAIHISKK